MIPNAKMDALENAPPENMFNRDIRPVLVCSLRAVKASGRRCSIAVRSTAETVCVVDDLINDVVATVLLELLQHGTLTAIAQLLSLSGEAGERDCY